MPQTFLYGPPLDVRQVSVISGIPEAAITSVNRNGTQVTIVIDTAANTPPGPLTAAQEAALTSALAPLQLYGKRVT